MKACISCTETGTVSMQVAPSIASLRAIHSAGMTLASEMRM